MIFSLRICSTPCRSSLGGRCSSQRRSTVGTGEGPPGRQKRLVPHPLPTYAETIIFTFARAIRLKIGNFTGEGPTNIVLASEVKRDHKDAQRWRQKPDFGHKSKKIVRKNDADILQLDLNVCKSESTENRPRSTGRSNKDCPT